MSAADFAIDSRASTEYRARGWWRNETVLDDFNATLTRVPCKLAIVSHQAGGPTTTLTFEELASEVERIAAGLCEVGVNSGDVVSVQLPNWWHFTAIYLACARIGAIMNPIVPILRRREVGHILQRTAAKISIVPTTFRDFDFAAMHLEVQTRTPSLAHVVALGEGVPCGAMSFEELLGGASKVPDARGLLGAKPGGADTPGQIQFTSGTTGEPKGVIHTYNTLYLSARAGVDVLQLDGGDVMLMASPLSHNTGFMYGMILPLMLGMTAVYQDQWDAQVALRLVVDWEVSVTMGSTTFLTDLCNAVDSASDVSSLRMFVCGGAPIPPMAATLVKEKLDAVLVACWGMTENGIATATAPGDPADKITGTDGRPMPWVALKVVDDHGEELPRNTPGRLLVKAANGHVAYLDRPDLYEASFEDGWFDTGDLARMDDDGYIRITGRVKDVIIRGGENIPALEVEAGLLQHSGVREVAIVGVVHHRLGECGCAVVVPTDPLNPPALSDLAHHLESLGMARTYWPERIEIRRELPRTASGKVQKFLLREQLRASDLESPIASQRPGTGQTRT